MTDVVPGSRDNGVSGDRAIGKTMRLVRTRERGERRCACTACVARARAKSSGATGQRIESTQDYKFTNHEATLAPRNRVSLRPSHTYLDDFSIWQRGYPVFNPALSRNYGLSGRSLTTAPRPRVADHYVEIVRDAAQITSPSQPRQSYN